MDVTVEAMIELSDRDERKTLELGIKLLKNYEGDTYFQAMIFDIIYSFDYCKVLDCLIRRNDNIEAYRRKIYWLFLNV